MIRISTSGHDSLPGVVPVCSCDAGPPLCTCTCLGCAVRRFDALVQVALGERAYDSLVSGVCGRALFTGINVAHAARAWWRKR